MPKLECVDMFGVGVNLRFRDGQKSSSFFGKMISFFLLVSVIIATILIGREIFVRSQPTTNLSEAINEDPPQRQIDSSTTTFAISLEDPTTLTTYMDPTIYQVSLQQTTLNRVKNTVTGKIDLVFTNREIFLEPCTFAHFGEAADKFGNIELNTFYCIGLNETIDLKGVWESSEHHYLALTVSKCSGASCQSTPNIDAKLQGGYFYLVYIDLVIDPTDFKNPGYRYQNAFFTAIGPKYSKEEDVYIQNIELTSDAGIITSSYENQNFIAVANVDERLDPYPIDDTLIYAEIRLNRNVKTYTRIYMKVMDLISQINGVLALVFVCLAVMIKPYAELKFYERLINQSFDLSHLEKAWQPPVVQSANDIEDPKSTAKNPPQKENFDFQDQVNHIISLNQREETQIRKRTKVEPNLESEREYLGFNLPETPKIYDYSITEEKPEEKNISDKRNEEELKLKAEMEEKSKIDPTEIKEKLNLQILKTEEVLLIEENQTAPTDRSKVRNMEIMERDKNEESTEKAKIIELLDKAKKEPKKLKINVGFFEYCLFKLCKCKAVAEKLHVLDEGIKNINERMDVFNVLTKLREIDKLKALLLTTSQETLFNNLPKPVLHNSWKEQLRHSKSDVYSKLINPTIHETGLNVKEAYRNLEGKRKKSEIDAKLLVAYDQLIVHT